MRLVVGVIVATGCALAPWAATRLPTRWALILAAPLLAVVVAGLWFGLAFYPASDVVVVAFSLLAGVALGRTIPARFRPFLLLLLILSVLDLAQNIAFSGPSPAPAGPATAAPDPHLVWLNFRIPLPGGHFNLGFADVLLIAAVSEHLHRRGAAITLSVLPGVIAVGLGEGLAATLPQPQPVVVTAVSQSLIPLLTAGYVLTELAVTQGAPVKT